MIIKISF